MNNVHIPVMVSEVIREMHIKTDGRYIDATLGAGGHTLEILKKGGRVLALDVDISMIEIAREMITQACPDAEKSLDIVNSNFSKIAQVAEEKDFIPVDGVLMDLGISSKHLDSDPRGFSFKDPASPLDMRLQPENNSVTAAQLLNALRKDQLEEMFVQGMDRGLARRWAIAVVKAREVKPLTTVGDLLALSPKKIGKINPATKAFMAIRIAVNSEMQNLVEGLKGAYEILAEEGVLAVITFHSGEDKLVKKYFRSIQGSNKLYKPSDKEVDSNPRARSAKLRIFKKHSYEIHELSQKGGSSSRSG